MSDYKMRLIIFYREIEQHSGGVWIYSGIRCAQFEKKELEFENEEKCAAHTCGCVSSVCADITIVVVLCILSSCSTGDFGG